MAYGLRPINKAGGGYQSGGMEEIPGTTGTACYQGDCVDMTNGFATKMAGSPVAVTPAYGVFMGCRYIDSSGLPQYSNYLPASGVTLPFFYVNTDHRQLFLVQANAAFVAATMRGFNSKLITFTGSTTTGLSNMVLDVGTLATTIHALRIVDIQNDPDNLTSATPNLIVRFAFGAHANQNVTGD